MLNFAKLRADPELPVLTSHLFHFWCPNSTFRIKQPTEAALGGIDLKMAKLNADNCGPCEFVLLSVSSEKSREFYCKTDTPENRTTWGGVLQSVINRLIEGRATFHGKPFFSPLPLDARTSAPEPTSSLGNTPRTTSTTSDSSDQAPPSPAGGSQFNPYAPAGGPNQPSSSSPGQPTQPYGQTSQPYGQPSPTATTPRSSDGIGANPASMSSPNLALSPRASTALPVAAFGTPGPMVPFNPVGGQEIVRVFLPDQSSKTILFDTTQSVETLCLQVRKKLGSGNYDNYALFVYAIGDVRVLPTDASVVSQVMNWPTKNDPEHYRLIFQPEQEFDREKASAIGFLEVKTTANAHSNVQKSSSFVSQMMGAVRSKPEWTGNITLASVPTPHLLRGNLFKKSSSSLSSGSKEILAVVTEAAMYYFDAAAGPQDKSKGWVPLEKAALYKERSPLSWIFYYIHPGTLDLSRSLEVSCRTEDDKKAWMAVLEPRCKGALPTKVKPPQRRAGSSPAVNVKPKEAATAPKADVAAMLESTPSEGPKLVHPTAGRPKAAGKRPPSARPKTSATTPINPGGFSSPFNGSGDYPSTAANTSTYEQQPYMVNSSSAPGLVGESPRYGTTDGSAPSSTATAFTDTPISTPGSTPNGSLVTATSGPVSPRYDSNTGYNGMSNPSNPYTPAPNSNNPYANPQNSNGFAVSSSPSQPNGAYMQPSGGSSSSLNMSPRPTTSSGNSPRLNGSSGTIPSTSPVSPRLMQQQQSPLQPQQPLQYQQAPQANARPAFSPPAAPGSPRTGPPTSAPPMPAVNGASPYGTAPAPNGSASSSTMPPFTPPQTTATSPYTLPTGAQPNPYAAATNPYQAPDYTSTFSNPAIASPGLAGSGSIPNNNRLVASPVPHAPGAALTGPNPTQFTVPPRGSPSPVLSPPGLSHPGQQFSNPALHNTAPQKPNVDTEADVLDIKSLLGYGSPALPKQQAFPTYTSPHISGPPLAPAKGSTIMYSPVLARPMPLQHTSPASEVKPITSTPFNSGASTTISITGNYQQQQPQDNFVSPFSTAPLVAPTQPPAATAGTVALSEVPTPVLMDLMGSPQQMDLSSPFDDCPFE